MRALEDIEAKECGVALPAGQHAVDAGSHQRLDGFLGVTRHVERAVAGDLHRPCFRAESGHPRLVDPSIRREAAEHHTGHTELAAGPHIVEHRPVFELGIKEVAAARPDDDVEWDRGDLQRLPDHAHAGRQAAFEQRGAEFHPVGPGSLRGGKAVDAFDADFNQRLRHYWTVISVRSPALTVASDSLVPASLASVTTIW